MRTRDDESTLTNSYSGNVVAVCLGYGKEKCEKVVKTMFVNNLHKNNGLFYMISHTEKG